LEFPQNLPLSVPVQPRAANMYLSVLRQNDLVICAILVLCFAVDYHVFMD
jgi:hypothetical protein